MALDGEEETYINYVHSYQLQQMERVKHALDKCTCEHKENCFTEQDWDYVEEALRYYLNHAIKDEVLV